MENIHQHKSKFLDQNQAHQEETYSPLVIYDWYLLK